MGLQCLADDSGLVATTLARGDREPVCQRFGYLDRHRFRGITHMA